MGGPYAEDAAAVHAPLFAKYPLIDLTTAETHRYMAWHYHHGIPGNSYGGAVQVDPGFSQLTPCLVSALETKI